MWLAELSADANGQQPRGQQPRGEHARRERLFEGAGPVAPLQAPRSEEGGHGGRGRRATQGPVQLLERAGPQWFQHDQVLGDEVMTKGLE